MALYLTTPKRRYRRAWEQFTQELGKDHTRIFVLFEEKKAYWQFLRKWKNFHTGRHLPRGAVPVTEYFLMEEGRPKILGVVNICHRITEDMLATDGHIYYAVAPSERRKGYATQQLRLALDICREMGIGPVLVTCDRDNIASAKVIQNNGGVLEDERMSGDGRVFQRYWITL